KSFFKNKINSETKKSSPIDDDSFIIACVLVEAALVDNNFGNEEKNIIIKLLQKQYKINIKDINDILHNAIETCKESSDLITYTKKIKQNWPIEKRIEVIEMLWKVCLVDGVLEPYEDMLIRRVSGLIYVDDKDRNLAKKNAIKKLDNYK
ncbi:MAG: TerB family tellurite resistance protein, partial [Pseudomonadota bacterium]|nr:TerB family tellurite resistance protein [Pseudomonadota bacterium]